MASRCRGLRRRLHDLFWSDSKHSIQALGTAPQTMNTLLIFFVLVRDYLASKLPLTRHSPTYSSFAPKWLLSQGLGLKGHFAVGVQSQRNFQNGLHETARMYSAGGAVDMVQKYKDGALSVRWIKTKG